MAYRVIFDGGQIGPSKRSFKTEHELKTFIESWGGMEEFRKLGPSFEVFIELTADEIDTVVMGNKVSRVVFDRGE